MKHLAPLTLLVLFIGLAPARAQDIHFSQYYASPATLNPATTGFFNGDFRVALNYRSQWMPIPTLNAMATYNTYQASFDYSLLRDRLDGNVLGIGGMFYADEAGDGSLTTQSAMISLAYHQKVDRFGRSRIGIGMQGGFVNKRIFQNDLLFEQQFDNLLNTFNPFLPNGEEANFQDQSIFYGDFNIGAMWSSRPTDKIAYAFGVTVNHVARPGESFLGSDNEIDHRYVVHGSAEFRTNESFKITPTFLYMLQSQFQQFNLGSGFEYKFAEEFSGHIGAWTRIAGGIDGFRPDAVILAIGGETYNTRLGISYDLNVSDLRAATNSNGALEVSLIYIHNKVEPGRVHWERFCPAF